MLIPNIDVNALKKNEKETSHDKGWGIMEQGAIALVVIIVLALVFGGLYMLRSRTGVANESSNIQTIITSTQGLLKGSDGYTFTSGAKMTGALIQMGGVPKTMTVRGTPSSGTATLYNSWGGAVTVAPLQHQVSTMVLPSPMKKSHRMPVSRLPHKSVVLV